MSENQQPLEEQEQTTAQAVSAATDETVSEQTEETALPVQADESLPEVYEDEDDSDFSDETEDDLAEIDTDDAEEEEEDEDIDPADVRIFGMPRVCFHFAAGGVAVGYILCGLVGLVAENAEGTIIGNIASRSPGATAWAIVCAVIGYLIGRQLHKKRLAAKEAELAEQAAETPDA